VPNGRMLDVKSLNISYHILNMKPSKFVVSNKGILYYSDDKGFL